MKQIPSNLRNTNTVFKKIVAVIGVSALSLSFAYAEVTLMVDENIKVSAINGKTVNKSLFQPILNTFKLQPGTQVITARYDRIYELRGDDHDYLKSDYITVTANMMDNQTYKLVMKGEPNKYSEAKEYVKNPTLAVMQGNSIVAQETTTVDDDGDGLIASIAGLIGGSSSAQQSNKEAIAAISSANSNSSNANSVTPVYNTSQPAVNSANTNTLDRFMQLWLQATPDERNKIRQWVQQ